MQIQTLNLFLTWGQKCLKPDVILSYWAVLPSVVCLSVIVKPRKMRRPKPARGCRAIEKKKCVVEAASLYNLPVKNFTPRFGHYVKDCNPQLLFFSIYGRRQQVSTCNNITQEVKRGKTNVLACLFRQRWSNLKIQLNRLQSRVIVEMGFHHLEKFEE
jgi:hypothetical protein